MPPARLGATEAIKYYLRLKPACVPQHP